MDQSREPVRFRVGDLEVDTASRRVMRGKRRLKLGGLTYDFFLALIETAPSYIGYDEIAARVWSGRSVTPETIAQRAKMLRDALGDDASRPRYFELIRGEGYRLVAEVGVSSDRPARSSSTKWVAPALGAVLAIALMLGFATSLFDDELPASIAVLPFTDLSPGGDQQYLADGMSEELINALTRLEGLEVASRTESFNFRGDANDIQEIGQTLRVSSVLEGSVRRSGDSLRVTVQLIDADSGYHLWSENFDRDVENIFAIQEDIARSVAGALGVKLGVGGVNDFQGAGTTDFEAYEAFLLGNFTKATELDPNYASAWGLRGLMTASTMFANPPEAAPAILEEAYGLTAKALELDPSSAQAHADVATIVYGTWQWNRAYEMFQTSLSIRRGIYNLGHFANLLMRAGRSSDALAVYQERTSRWVLEEPAFMQQINVDIALKRYDVAREKAARMHDGEAQFMALAIAFNDASLVELRDAMQALPETSDPYRLLYSEIQDRLDQPEAVIAFLEELANDPNRNWPSKHENIALVAAYLGYPELAFEIFSRELQYTPIRLGTVWYPVMSDVRRLPAFKQFVTEIKLVEFWRTYGWPDFCRPLGYEDFVCD